MKFYDYIVVDKKDQADNSFILHLKPKDTKEIISFTPGQYCFIRNPESKKFDDARPFSIASAPHNNYLEFCIKRYGEWTLSLSQINEGDSLIVSDPQGNFVWDPSLSYAVFLVGGLGISPIMSILRYLEHERLDPHITLLYGNRTPETIMYKKELEKLTNNMKHFTVIHIFSHITEDHPWKGHRGFISADIIQKEVELNEAPTFFLIGPPIFIEKMNTALTSLSVDPKNIRQEKL